MNSSKKFLYQVVGNLHKDQLEFKVTPWKLLIETNRYYEIKAATGPVKRLYKEKLNTAVLETKHYCDGRLIASVFCREGHIEEAERIIINHLAAKIDTYMKDLQLNQKVLCVKLNCPESAGNHAFKPTKHQQEVR
ncbi:hypothetical protein ACTNDP_03370 [Paenibacillus barengoltzii]|uniref:hypothetical protein n=1 Tax=Paenibacillus barengoltzii TaxID=343517 RepID=UPI003F8C7946